MGLRDLFFAITASDNTGTAFASVNRNLRTTEGLSASVGERLGRAGGAMQRFGARGSIASAGIVAVFRDSLQLFDEQERAEARVRTAIESTGRAAGFTADELFRQASALQAVTRFGDEDILGNVTAQLLTFTNVSGTAFERAQKVVLDFVATTGRGALDTSIQFGKALNDPVKGLSALSRAGIQFSDAQKDLIKDMVAAGDVAGAQALILDELERQYGGQAEAARAAGTGVVDAFSNSFGDLKEIVGGVLLRDVLPPIVEGMQSVVSAFQEMDEPTQRFAVLMGAAAVAAPPLIAALGLVAAGLGALLSPIGLAVAAIAGIGVAAFVLKDDVVNAFTAIGTFISDTVSGIGEAAFALKDDVVNAFTAIGTFISDTVTGIGAALRDRLGGIMDSVSAKIEFVEEKFAWLWDRVVGNSWVPDMVDGIGAAFARLDSEMVAPTIEATGMVDTAFADMGRGIGERLGGALGGANDDFGNFFESVLDQGRDFARRLLDDVFGQLGKGIEDALSGIGGSSGGGGLFGGIAGGFVSGLGGILGNVLGFDQGGAFTVRGRAGMDRNLATVRLSEGEEVRVTRRGGDNAAPVINVIIQTPDPAAFKASRAQIGRQLSAAVAAGQRAS